MSAVAAQPHVTLSGDRAGEYVIGEERPDGALLLVPDTSMAAIRRRHALTPATLAEFEAKYGQIRPPDDVATQPSQDASRPRAPASERPKPPDVLEREERQPTRSPIQRLIERIAV